MNQSNTTGGKIAHHLDEKTLLAYSAGTLPEAVSLMVAAHVSMCDSCRAQLSACDAVGGHMLEGIEPQAAEMKADSLAQVMARLAETPTEVARQPSPPCDVLPKPVQDYVGGTLDQVRWRPIGMGVKQAILKTDGDATARLLFIPAGAAMPEHGHEGLEMTLVLKGAFQDDDDYFARGDVEIANEDVDHTPIADVHEDCICLAVTNAPLKFQGFLPRIVQKFARI